MPPPLLRALASLIVLVAIASSVDGTHLTAQSTSFEVAEATIDDLRAALAGKRMTCRTLVQQYLRRIEAYDKAGPALNAVQTVNARALEEADRLDAAFATGGPTGPLHCIPVLVKDQLETSDMPTTYGSALFKDFVPARDATVVRKLKAAGAIVLAKTTMGEFASGYLGSAFGIVHNAYDPTRIPSGSSGGTGAGVAASYAAVGIGEDTGGSVRGPAAHNNQVGLRPTVPLVSRAGMLPARPTTDTVGPMARTVRDAAILLDVIAGYDAADPVTAAAVGHVPASYAAGLTADGLKGARIGVIRDPLDPTADRTAAGYLAGRTVFDRAVADLRRLGAEVVDMTPIANLARDSVQLYDGNVFETEAATDRYLAGHANAPVRTYRDIVLSGKVVPARVRPLASSLGHDTGEPGYLRHLLLREQVREAVFNRMAEQRLDALAYLTFDYPPLAIPANAMTLTTIDSTGLGNNRRLSPVIDFPAISVPAGFAADGLPMGLELMARPFAEATLFRLAYAYEQGTKHRRPSPRTPPLGAGSTR